MKKIKILKRIATIFVAASMSVSLLAGCSKGKSTTSDGKADTSKPVTITMYLWGSAGVDNKKAMSELNAKLKKKINAKLEMKYVPWDALTTKYPLIFASGEPYDLIYTSSAANPNYFSLTEKGSFKDITDLLPKYAPQTWKNTSKDTWNDTKYEGKIYAVPSRYSEYIPHGFIYKGSIAKKYGISSINSLDDMEKYFDAVLKNEKDMIPWDANSSNAIDIYNMFAESTSTLIPAPGLDQSTMYLTATSKNNVNDVIDPVFTEDFMKFAERMKKWSDKGYWTKDVLSTKNDPLASFNSGKASVTAQHFQGFVGWYGDMVKAQPKSDPQFYGFGLANKKVVKTRTMQNATAVNANSKNPERALMMLDLLMNNKEIYDLFQYGIKGRNYDVNGAGKRITPAKFDAKKDAYGQSAWATRTDDLEIPMATDYPARAEKNKEFDAYAIKDPYASFNFNSKAVASQIAAVNQVNSTYGVPILFGKVNNVKSAVEDYRRKLKAAGIDKIIAELKNQLKNYKPVK